jgi:hypothetical protein
MIPKALAAAIVTLVTGIAAADAAEVTVKLLHVEQNPQVSGFWKEIARSYMAAHAGVKVDIQYLENEAYKKKLTTLLQSQDRPHIVYSWGGGVLREQMKASVIEDLSSSVRGRAHRRRHRPSDPHPRNAAVARTHHPPFGVLRRARIDPVVRSHHAAHQGRTIGQHADHGHVSLQLRRDAHAHRLWQRGRRDPVPDLRGFCFRIQPDQDAL